MYAGLFFRIEKAASEKKAELLWTSLIGCRQIYIKCAVREQARAFALAPLSIVLGPNALALTFSC